LPASLRMNSRNNPAPLQDVAVHVEESKGVGWERAHRRCVDPLIASRGLTGTAGIGAIVGVFVIAVRSPWEGGSRSGARGVFPLSLRRQAIEMPSAISEPVHVVLRIVPGHAHDRMSVILRKTQMAPGSGCIGFVGVTVGQPAVETTSHNRAF